MEINCVAIAFRWFLLSSAVLLITTTALPSIIKIGEYYLQ